jgi:hypothetical protein
MALERSSNDHWTVKADKDLRTTLQVHFKSCKTYLQQITKTLQEEVRGGSPLSHRYIATRIEHCPRISPAFWLRQLNQKNFDKLSDEWKTLIVRYGLAITELRRAHRLLGLFDNPLDLAKEYLNKGHENWEPARFPESLLFEAESGIMIRTVQEQVAGLMRSPPSGRNSMMQLNMGEGKSAVIIPIVAASLADGSR